MKQAVIVSSAALAALFATSTSAASPSDPPTPVCDVIQRGALGDVRDAEIWSLNPSYHVPDSYEVNTGYSSAYGEKRALFGFELGAIPAGALISSARFHVSTYSSTNQTVRVHRVLAPWSEADVTWDSLGGVDPAVVASFESVGGAWREIDLTGLVQDWVSGVVPNYGILLEEDLPGRTSYKSSDHPNPDNHPFIEVCYLPPTGSIGGAVWVDGDADGLYDPELGVDGVVVDLFDGDTLIDSTVTGVDPSTGQPGFYHFDELYPGDYTVVVASDNFEAGGPLAGHEPTVDHDGGGDGVAVISLAPGEDLHDAGFGYQPSCGNGVCGGGESCSTCAADCGACPPVCGDGVCGGGESCSTCSADCGTCAPVCGDGVCSAGAEDCSSCASDCGVCECTSPGTATPNDWADNVGGLRVLFLTIGGRVYLNLQLVAILLRPDRGDMTYLLAKQLIAAKLNVGLGNWSTCIEATIAAADAWLRIHPVGSNVIENDPRSAWASGEALLERLEAYNYGELCAPHRDDVHCGGD
ncbi:DNRLRE domain-containing protein [Sorangium sp. So ce834]|uniref:DNRLRE domain-containing protein n=1 Tax=Sorangium sp. So ce834 TaxID=3133321 RepID=UPI003F60077D